MTGGTNASSNPTQYTIETDTITLASPIKSDYLFVDWYEDCAFTQKITTITRGSYGKLTLYSKWELATEGLVYSRCNNDKEYKISGYTGSAQDVFIPSLWNGLPVNSIARKAFIGCNNLTSITIPESVTSIGNSAFT